MPNYTQYFKDQNDLPTLYYVLETETVPDKMDRATIVSIRKITPESLEHDLSGMVYCGMHGRYPRFKQG